MTVLLLEPVLALSNGALMGMSWVLSLIRGNARRPQREERKNFPRL